LVVESDASVRCRSCEVRVDDHHRGPRFLSTKSRG
jgi:hypothetical protein